MAQHLPTFNLNATLVRSGEVTGADWVDGANRAASCAPGVGVAVLGGGGHKVSDWSLLDQFGNARDPQASQHIGEVDDGSAGLNPINVADYAGGDFNDTTSLLDLNVGWIRNAVV